MTSDHLPTPATREELKKIAIQAAQRAGAIMEEHTRHGFRVEHKDRVNLVTDADRRAEEAIVHTILIEYPSHQILAEERGLQTEGHSPFKWVIDPLDGTTNFAHGFPAYCTSIGLEYEGRCILGVVLDPTRQELFVAEAGRGAFLNGAQIHVSRTPKLDAALLVTGFAYDIRESPNNNLDHFARFALRAQGLRRTGTAALDLCYVAAGRFDGFWELKLHPWDTAAGALIVSEAGGRVTDFKGEAYSIYNQEIAASNGLIHDEMLKVLQRA
ncbi:MAG TPA: inositol monophosphatase family protein [Nitrospiraceae bacterium]|nr:inositol monophosphatase family protein [Nitrospiraceae bacterium]